MSASSNDNENSTGPAGRDALLEALLRARRAGSVPSADAFGFDAGTDAPLRSRSGGVNKPRAVVPAPLLAAEAARLVDTANTKRARMVTAIGVPAVFLAATGVAVVPTVANAASASPASTTSTSCAPGSTAVANPGAKSTTATSAPSTAPTSAPSKAGSAPSTPGTPLPTSAPTTKQPAPNVPSPSGAPSGTSTPVKPTPTSVPSSTTAPPSSAPSSAAPTTSTPTSTATWWNPLTWLGGTVNQVFNPAPSSSSSTVNKLAAAPANPTSSPTSSPSPILSIGLGDPSSSPSPSGTPTSNPTSVPSTPQPTSGGSSAPSAPPSSAPSTPTSSASTPSSSASSAAPSTITYQGQTYQLPTTSCVSPATPGAMREVEWHLDASSLTLTNQHFVGFQYIDTGDGKQVQVMVIHADRVDLTDMVTYNEDGNTKIYSDGGKGKNVSLTNVTLHVLQQKGVIHLPILGIPLGQVTLGPPEEAGTDPTSQLVMGLLQLNLPLPPTTFTDVHVDQYTLTSDTLNIPHFNVSLNGVTPQS